MAYSEALAERIREAIEGRSGVTERKMFGDVFWMINGHVAVGTLGENLMVRLEHEDIAGALLEPHVSPVKFTGRPASEFVAVDAAGIDAEADLARWVDAGADHAASRPPK
jgi:hypothetical protein